MPWVAERLFAAGGDFVLENWQAFQAQAGVSAIITVHPTRFEPFTEPAPWAMLWLPLAHEADFTEAHLRLGASFISAALDAKRSVLLYAPAGLHRVRPLAAARQILSGHSLARVLREMEARPWLPPYKGNLTVLEALARQATARPEST